MLFHINNIKVIIIETAHISCKYNMYKATAKTSKESCLNLSGDCLKKGSKRNIQACLRNKHLLATYFNSTQTTCHRLT